MPRSLPILLLLALLAVAQAPAPDLVNERLPVRRSELEAHWGVDCTAAWAELERLAGAGSGCGAAPELQQALRLCAFVYQPSGELPVSTCRDFRAALAVIRRDTSAGTCRALTRLLTAREQCLQPQR